jgi:hypothetical protein
LAHSFLNLRQCVLFRLGTEVTFTVNATANSLAPGTYGPTTITFTNANTGQGTQTRTATLTVNPPALQVTPATGDTASGTHGGPFSPSSFNYALISAPLAAA